jgi:hypothetical protein
MTDKNADQVEIDRAPAIGILNFGQSYIQAAEIVLRQIDSGNEDLRFHEPILFLLGHGFELMFKAFLRAKGSSPDDLKKFGHNLERLFEAAMADGLKFSPDGTTMPHLTLLSRHFGPPYEVRYFTIGYRIWPDPRLLLNFAKQLYPQLLPICMHPG